MKKCFMTMFCLLATVATMTSCKKENNGFVTLNAELENVGNGKVYMDGQLPMWNDGDSVWVNGNGCAISMTTSGASISIPAEQVASSYLAVYPYSSVTGQTNDQITVKIPTTQAWQTDANGYQKVSLPMAAYNNGTGKALQFRNLASLVKVTVTNNESSAITLNSVKLTATTSTVYLSGSASIAKSGIGSSPYPALTFTSGSNDVILNGINTEITASGSMVVYLVVPTFTTATQMKITIYTSAGQQNKTGGTSAAMTRNQIAIIPYTTTSTWTPASGDIEMLPGEFTVNKTTGKKVHFAKGNVYCTRTGSGSPWVWNTNSQQYECQYPNGKNGVGSSTDLVWNDNYISLFRAGYNGDPNGNGDESTYTYAIDFGQVFSGSWFTLTPDEWKCLLALNGSAADRQSGFTLTATNTTTTKSNTAYIKCQVKVQDSPEWYVNGLLIFPDGFSMSDATEAGVTFTGSGLNNPGNVKNLDYTLNSYTTTQILALEGKGCVFLPAAGACQGTNKTRYTSYESQFYKSTSKTNPLSFGSTNVSAGDLGTNRTAIRLVTTVAQ